MSHQDSSTPLNAECLKRAIDGLTRGLDLSAIVFRRDCTWLPLQLVTAALVWAWSDEATLTERFHTASKIVGFILCPQQEFARSYQAFIKLLCRWTEPLVALVQQHLRERTQRTLAAQWLVHGFAVFGVDGSRIELPRTRSHEQRYGRSPKKKAKRKQKRGGRGHGGQGTAAQMWLTTLWHMGTGLPWDWRSGPAESSERGHWMEMLPGLPPLALIAADAGFVGYEYAQRVLASGRHLVLRVGSNVHLLKRLGFARERDNTVYVWPERAARRQQPPLVFRLLVIHNGKHPVYLLTSVLEERRLSDEQVIEIYRGRWGIELFYRHLKQTFQRRKLRSASADNAHVELEWSLVGLWAMGLYAQAELLGRGVMPRKISVAGVLRAFRRMLRDYQHPQARGATLRDLVRRAIVDAYQRRNKTSRNYPRKKQEQPPGPPSITIATQFQVTQAQQIKHAFEKGLSA